MENGTDPTVTGEGGQPQDPKAGEGGQPQDPKTTVQPQDSGQGEGGQPQDPKAGEGTVTRHQYERDIERRDKRIAELEGEVKAFNDSKAAQGDQAAKALKEIESLKAQLADEKLASTLATAGCIDVKAAKARLDDFGGDVAKLKEAAPYLFAPADKTPRTTGGYPAGASSDELRAKARKAAGLK